MTGEIRALQEQLMSERQSYAHQIDQLRREIAQFEALSKLTSQSPDQDPAVHELRRLLDQANQRIAGMNAEFLSLQSQVAHCAATEERMKIATGSQHKSR